MGLRESRFSALPFEEACRRVDPKDMQRIKAAFKKASNSAGMMTKNTFIGEVIGDIVPNKIAEQFFFACGGSSKGISFKEVLTGLVVITRSTMEEKEKFIFNMISKDGIIVSMDDIENFQTLCGQNDHSETSRFFSEVNILMSEQEFYPWLRKNRGFTPVTQWLLIEQMSRNSVTFSSIDDPQSFIQTLAQIANMTEDEIVTLEKRYGMIRTSSKCGQLDLETLKHQVKSFVSADLCQGLFAALDSDNDGFIDFKELVCGISECCRGSLNERITFCFKVFDQDRDGSLSRLEASSLTETLFLQNGNFDKTDKLIARAHELVDEMVGRGDGSSITLSGFLTWASTRKDIENLCLYLSQICHVLFALRPHTPKQEGAVVRKWLEIQESQGLQQSQIYYLVAMPWWISWKQYVVYEEKQNKELVPTIALNDVNQYLRLTERGGGRSPTRNNGSNGIRRSHTTVAPLTTSAPLTLVNGKTGQPQSTQALGPVDNSSLIVQETKKLPNLTAEGGSLKQNTILVRGRDFEIVSEPVWHALFTWYGANTPLPRTVIVPSEYDKDPSIELYPLQLQLYRHRPPLSRLPHISLPSLGISNFSSLHGATHAQNNKHNTTGAQASAHVVIPKRTPMYRAAFSRKNTLKQVHHYLCSRLNLKTDDVRLWDMNHEGQTLLLEEEDKTLEDLQITTGRSLLIEVRNQDLSWPEEMNSLVASKTFRERSNTGILVSGATGLHNLGNTCFMNSAIQCISNIDPLRQYFILQRHLYELNKENPLGLKGTLAKRYGELMEDLWSGIFRSIAPVKLRWTIGKYAPRFTGFAQHDSQELLSFLLDGLHEDLNRVHDKPYVELQDSEGRSDKEVADEAWESHLKRNQSIVVDLFHGQLKSQVRCLACANCSVRFDPYTFLSLPLPMENSLHIEIVVFWASKSVPTKYALLLASDCKVQKLREQLAGLCSIPRQNLVLAEIAAATIMNFPKDSQKLRCVTSGHLVAYEVPFTSASMLNATTTTSSVSTAHPNVDNTLSPQPSPLFTGAASAAASSSGKETLLHVASPALEGYPSGVNDKAGRNYVDAAGTVETDVQVKEVAIEAKEVTEQGASPGYVTLMHRKMIYRDFYFLSWQRFLPLLFGSPLLIACPEGALNKNIYDSVWNQVCRLVSNADSGDSGTNGFPFTLTWTDKNGHFCAVCPWYRFCRGCVVPRDDEAFERKGLHLCIDWDHKTLHLYYQPSQERVVQEDSSVVNSWTLLHEPIDLDRCLKDFTKEEELGQDETWFCPKCKKQQSIAKKIDLWSLPPILVIHLKRFQQLNNRWVKSNKIVKFPMEQLDPSKYLVEARRNYYRNSRSISLRHFNRDSVPSERRAITGTTLNNGESTEIENLVIDLDCDEKNKDGGEFEHAQCSPVGDASSGPSDQLYHLCALSCHTGLLNGGHYISYAKNPNGKWYCYNDSTCKEVDADIVENESPYMLFYQRNGLDYRRYLPDVANKGMVVDEDDSKEFETDVKRICSIQ